MDERALTRGTIGMWVFLWILVALWAGFTVWDNQLTRTADETYAVIGGVIAGVATFVVPPLVIWNLWRGLRWLHARHVWLDLAVVAGMCFIAYGWSARYDADDRMLIAIGAALVTGAGLALWHRHASPR